MNRLIILPLLLALTGLAAPANDNFANRIPLVSAGGISTRGNNIGATTESGEPDIGGRPESPSVWWSWVSPTSEPVTIDTKGSNFDTTLSVFVGTAVNNLTEVASNDDSGGLTSSVEFDAVQGVEYEIAGGGYGFSGKQGIIQLNVKQGGGGGGCTYTISPTGSSFSDTGGSGSVSIVTKGRCSWSALSNDGWLTVTSGSTGRGSATVRYTVAQNFNLSARTGTLTISGRTFTVVEAAAPACPYAINPTLATYTSDGGTNTIAVAAGTGCTWIASVNANWIAVTGGGSGSGNGTVGYSVAANTTSNTRTGNLTIAGQIFTVSQDGLVPCSYTISPTTASFAAVGGSTTIAVSTQTGCSWTASSPDSWVTITSGTTGSGNGTVGYTVAANASTSGRSSTLTVAGQGFTISQVGAACTYSINPSAASIAYTGGSASCAITTTSGCNWTSSSAASWVTITSGSSGSGSGTLTYSVAVNPDTVGRVGVLTIAGHTLTVTQGAAPCSYSIAPTTAAYLAAGGNGSINVTAGTGCAWTAVSNAGWITINTGAAGTANGTVTYSVAANGTASSRTSTITVAGSAFTITEDGTTPCVYGISPLSNNILAVGGSGTVTVTTGTGCLWTSASNAGWITIASGASGSGNGTATYNVAANTSSIARSGTLTIAGQTFTVNQSGVTCTFALSSTSASFGSAVGNGSLSVTSPTGCNWTTANAATWITITSGSSGTGNGTVGYTVAANTDTVSRSANMTVAGQTFTVTQIGAPCTFSLSPLIASFTDVGGNGLVNVTAGTGCTWTATSSANWITITLGSAGSGSGTVGYTVTATTSIVSRSGILTIAGQTFTVTQSGDTSAPTVTLTIPANGSTVSNAIVLTATASDDIGVGQVNFYRDAGVLLGSATVSPYQLPFNTTNALNASHGFYAIALDQAGNNGISTTNTVTVNNPAPPAPSTNTWVNGFGGAGATTVGRAITVDGSGNIIVAFYFIGTANFGGGNLTSAGTDYDMALAKYDSTGAFVWAKRIGSTGREIPNAVAVDSGGNIIVGGYFNGSTDLGGGALLSAGGFDIFVAKYNSSGTFIWGKRFGGSADDAINSLALDGSNNIVITGYFSGSIDFGGGALTEPFAGTGPYLAKFNSSGTHVWSESFTANSAAYGQSVAIDGSGNIFLGGYFLSDINLGAGSIITAGSSDAFVAKFNSGGTLLWGNALGGTGSDSTIGIAIDSTGNINVLGFFVGPATIAGVSLNTFSGGIDTFLAKFSSSGTGLWARSFSSIGNVDSPRALAVDANGNSVVTGHFTSAIDLGGGTLNAPTTGIQAIYQGTYSTTGGFLAGRVFGGPTLTESSAIVTDANHFAVITGIFQGTINFGIRTLTPSGPTDTFVMRLNP